MAFLQTPERPLDELPLFQLSLPHPPTQAAQIADQLAQPAPAHGAFFLPAPGAAAEHINFVGFGEQLHLQLTATVPSVHPCLNCGFQDCCNSVVNGTGYA